MGKVLPPIYGRLGARLRQLREHAKVTQEQLAERIEVGKDYIGTIEGGSRRVQIETLANIASALKVPLATCFPEHRPVLASKAQERSAAYLREHPAGLSDRELEELIDLMRALDRDTARSYLGIARQLSPRR